MPTKSVRKWLVKVIRRKKLSDSLSKVLTVTKRRMEVLPLELLEMILLRTFVKLFHKHLKSHRIPQDAIGPTYRALAAVCFNWWQTMNGWPQSTTRHWFKHKLLRGLDFVCHPVCLNPRLESSQSTLRVVGVTQCDDKLFVVCSSSEAISVYHIKQQQQQLASLRVPGLRCPTDIAACTETRQLYIADHRYCQRLPNPDELAHGCVWRVSLDAPEEASKWLPATGSRTRLRPRSLSVRSRRLLVTSGGNKLLLYGPDGAELKRVSSLELSSIRHAVETSRGTIVIVSFFMLQSQVSEIDADGDLLRVYIDLQPILSPDYLSLDSDGRIFVADSGSHQVLLLNSRLELERVVLMSERHGLANWSHRLCYVEGTGQLIVGSYLSNCVQVFNLRAGILPSASILTSTVRSVSKNVEA